jgi:hypothetical protein
MTDEARPKPVLTATDIATRAEMPIRHPWNPNSEVYLKHLGMMRGCDGWR